MIDFGFTCSGRVGVDGRRVMRLTVVTGESVTEMTWSTTDHNLVDQVVDRLESVFAADDVHQRGAA